MRRALLVGLVWFYHRVGATILWDAYEDLLAHPQYNIIFEEAELPSNLLQVNDNFDFETLNMCDGATGQKFKCTISKQKHESSKEKSSEEIEAERLTVEQGISALESLKKSCLYSTDGEWNYEICYGRHIRQYFPRSLNDRIGIADAGKTLEYFLSYFGGTPGQPGGSEPNRLKSRTSYISEDGSSRYLSQFWNDGTKCDITGRPRKTEVQFHCHEVETVTVQEMTVCSYLVLVRTPQLCKVLPRIPPQSETNVIRCYSPTANKVLGDSGEQRRSIESKERMLELKKEKDSGLFDSIYDEYTRYESISREYLDETIQNDVEQLLRLILNQNVPHEETTREEGGREDTRKEKDAARLDAVAQAKLSRREREKREQQDALQLLKNIFIDRETKGQGRKKDEERKRQSNERRRQQKKALNEL
ncbi:uncharacterized protein VTP21DRAFT_2047 [Calcarisporiella thermophila]|uniref:uncharacterized protein n=1 Tax=Calcarisporiella thermophila TaxID=911321 RepID=UPI0037437B4C